MIFPPFFKRLGDLRVPVESGLWIIHHLVFLHKSLRFLLAIHLPADTPVSLFIHPAVPTQQHSQYTCLLPVSRGLLMMAAVPPCVAAINLCLASQGSAQGLFCFVFFPRIVTWKVGRHQEKYLHWDLWSTWPSLLVRTSVSYGDAYTSVDILLHKHKATEIVLSTMVKNL